MSCACAQRPARCADKSPKAKTLLLVAVLTLAVIVVIRAAPTVEALDSEEQAFLQLINTYRQQNGLQPLSLSPTLTTAAELHSEDMAYNDYFSHTSLDGRTFVDRVEDAGYTYDTWLGENIAAGYSTAGDVFDAWKNSSTHDANMLMPEFEVIGIGRAYNASSYFEWYWTTDFGGYDDSEEGETTTTVFSSATTTVLATTTTVATTTVTTTMTSTLTQTSTGTVTTAASTSTVTVTTLTTTFSVTVTTTINTTENRTYTFLTTYSSISTVATSVTSTTTEVQVTTAPAGVTTETSTSTVEKKATVTKTTVETFTHTTTTLSYSSQNVTATVTEPVGLTETVTVHQRAPTTVGTAVKTVPSSGFPWDQNLPLLATLFSLAAVVAVLAALALRKH